MLFIIIVAVFYGDRDIKMSHSIFGTISEKIGALKTFSISNIVGNIFFKCCSFISGSKPWDSLLLFKVMKFKKYFTVFYS